MRKIMHLITLIYLFCGIQGVQAQVHSVFPMTEFLRNTGTPIASEPIIFISNAGAATLKIYNGALDEFEKSERVSSSKIIINGIDVLGPNYLNQNVPYIEKEIALKEENELTVELRSKPGGRIWLEIIQDAKMNLIGPDGGTVSGEGGVFL